MIVHDFRKTRCEHWWGGTTRPTDWKTFALRAISAVVCLSFPTHALSGNDDNGIRISRWQCFQPAYYECNTYEDLDQILERINGWDANTRKRAWSRSGELKNNDKIRECNSELFFIAQALAGGRLVVPNKKQSMMNIGEFLIHNTEIQVTTELPRIKQFNISNITQGVDVLRFSYLGDWEIISSHQNMRVAQCYYGTKLLEENFAIDRNSDVERIRWRIAARDYNPYSRDIIERLEKPSLGPFTPLDLQIAQYWIQQSAAYNGYSRDLWEEFKDYYDDTFDTSDQLEIQIRIPETGE